MVTHDYAWIYLRVLLSCFVRIIAISLLACLEGSPELKNAWESRDTERLAAICDVHVCERGA